MAHDKSLLEFPLDNLRQRIKFSFWNIIVTIILKFLPLV